MSSAADGAKLTTEQRVNCLYSHTRLLTQEIKNFVLCATYRSQNAISFQYCRVPQSKHNFTLFQMKPARGTLFLSVVRIYFNFSTCFGQLCAHHPENLLYLCDTGIFHSVWLAVWSSLHVSGNYVPIIRRTYRIYATLVFFHSV